MANFLEVAALDLLATQYVSVAAVGLLFYDHIITFSDEVALIWPAKFGLVKAVFLFNRYFISIWIAVSLCLITGLATFLTPLTCRYWLIANVYIELATMQTISFIVAIRVYDIWQSQRLVFFVLGPFWLIHCVADIFIATTNVLRHYQSFTLYPIFNICFGTIQHSWTFWLNGILYHALILLILLYVWLSTPRTSQTPLMQVVVRDGLWYFVTIFCAMLFNLLVWRYGRSSMIGVPYTSVWCITLTSLSRMLLSMGSVQTPEEWGQRAKIQVPSSREMEMEIELGGLSPESKRASSFA
ncbi:transmembrane protein [Ceratobasidium sp. AG-Ba]|nr:transmembrane protein [Ceratobasidium sp. AG-Ba]